MNKLMRPQKGQSLTEAAVCLFVIAVICLAIWAVIGDEASMAMAEAVGSIDLSTSHAAERHGDVAIAAENCFNTHGTAQSWSKPSMNRRADICYEAGRYYVRIVEKRDGVWYELTKFARDQARTLGDVGRYLKNNGYTR